MAQNKTVNYQSQETSMRAPFNFVPLSPWIYLPEWAGMVSHDVPLKDGVSGHIDLKLKTHSPLLVSGQQNRSSGEKSASKVVFNRGADGNPRIPGTSLKGLVRNVLEIASFGKMQYADDQRFGVRDLTDAAIPYYRQKLMNKVKTGWLRFEQGKWMLYPCGMVRVKQDELSTIPQFKQALSESRAFKRYNVLNVQRSGYPKVSYKSVATKSCQLATELNKPGAKEEGYLVFTGQVPKKKKEFVFGAPSKKAIEIPKTVMQNMIPLHAANPQNKESDWDWFKQHKMEQSELGIPLFYLANNHGTITAAGLAFMFKLPFDLSVHEAIGNVHKGHTSLDEVYDLAELIFGTVRKEGEGSLQARASFSDAVLSKGGSVAKPMAVVLNSPKPSYFPEYVQQDSANSHLNGKNYQTFSDANARIAGWKRYAATSKPQGSNATKDNLSVQSELHPLEKGAEFSVRLRFFNLQPQELGALIWAITWGGDSQLRHTLGMGKPFGLGLVSFEIGGVRIETNSGNETKTAEGFMQTFVDSMQEAYKSIAGSAAGWDSSNELTQLKALATPDFNSWQSLSYMKLKNDAQANEFIEAKKSRLALSEYAPNHDKNTNRILSNQSVEVMQGWMQKRRELEIAKQEAEQAEQHQALLESLSEEDKDVEIFFSDLAKLTDDERRGKVSEIEALIEKAVASNWPKPTKESINSRVRKETFYLASKNKEKERKRNLARLLA
jgi:CRISPR-associated protein (TIGR03986 family)